MSTWKTRGWGLIGLLVVCTVSGCKYHTRPLITAKPASPQNQDEPDGIPFYLPKPLLVVSKNVYHIEETKVGLTNTAPIPNGFDAQAQYADVNNRSAVGTGTSSATAPDAQTGGEATASEPKLHSGGAPVRPGELPAGGPQIPSDGLAPHTFYTYEIVFVPDLTQKYVMDLRGGPGEIRAAMNLVNGWQFTGLGPYYVKDSSTAQNILSAGIAGNLLATGASDVITSIAQLRTPENGQPEGVSVAQIAALGKVLNELNTQECIDWNTFGQPCVLPDGRLVAPRLENYAEIHVWEPVLDGCELTWRPVVDQAFDREVLGTVRRTKVAVPGTGGGLSLGPGSPISGAIDTLRTLQGSPAPRVQPDPAVVQSAMEHAFRPKVVEHKTLFEKLFHWHHGKTETNVVTAPLPTNPVP